MLIQRLTKDELIKDRSYLIRRIAEMRQEFSSFRGHYRELSEFVDPRRGRFFVTDRNKGDKRYKSIINNKASRALRTATAGMLAGMMSPSRPWFVWTLLDKALASYRPVKLWLALFQRIILLIAARSNFYNMSPTMLKELLLFGTGCMTHVDDFEDIARFYTLTGGSYYIAQNDKLQVDTLAREFQMTSSQLVTKFGDKVSTAVKAQYNRGNYGSWHTVNQFIEINPNRDEKQLGSEFLPFRSVYFEAGAKAADKDLFLERKGFKFFPAYVPRWELTGEDIYATSCPGMVNLGDIKQLQTQEKEKAKAIAKSSTPPLQGPASLRNQPIPNIPGGVTINTAMGQGQKLESIYKVDPRIQEMLIDISATEARIDEGFFVDLFMAITQMRGIQPKNEMQLSQMNSERLLQLGPVLEQVHGEWLSKMLRRIAKQVLEAGIMPDAPPELQGQELELEFVSALAMAQKAVTVSGIEQTMNFASGLTEAGFDVRPKVDADAALEEYADLVGAPVRIIVPDADAAEIRKEEAAKLQRQEQLAAGEQAAKIMKMAADAKLGDDNVLSAASGRA